MGTVGLVTEYNPFHNGHLYHLEQAKLITNSEYSIAVMSGNFLQRGEPALVDKWTRAKMAVDNGVDLVLELPVIYSCQSAEFFSYGAVKLLNSLGVVDSICFGSELGEVSPLVSIANILLDEPYEYKLLLRDELDKGLSYPKSRSIALMNLLQQNNLLSTYKLEDILNNPNNILSIEYIKALLQLRSSIKPYTIRRIANHYSTKELTGSISSATAIRESIFNSNDLMTVRDTLPNASYESLRDFLVKFKGFNIIDNFDSILLYKLRIEGTKVLSLLFDIDEGLENRFYKFASSSSSIKEILDLVNTKRYTYTRLQRIMCHLLIGVYREEIEFLHGHGPQYIRVLAMNNKGIKLLNEIKNKSDLPIITKFADHGKFNNSILDKMIDIDKKATDIYFLGINHSKPYNMDYITSPYIKK